MKNQRKRKLTIILTIVTTLMVATLLIMYALRQNINLFYTPAQVAAGKVPARVIIRLGGMVVDGSVKHQTNSLKVGFTLTDYNSSVPVTYEGILPALFREGQGIVARGQLEPNGVFIAEEVLAKHDSTYMPPEVRSSLKKEA